jgi:hypothetical protein
MAVLSIFSIDGIGTLGLSVNNVVSFFISHSEVFVICGIWEIN